KQGAVAPPPPEPDDRLGMMVRVGLAGRSAMVKERGMANRIHTDAMQYVLLTVGVLGLVACGSTAPSETGGTDLPDGPGSIAGRVTFSGTPPPRQEVRVSSDPNCVIDGDRLLSETLIVGEDGGLQNVFVYVKDGLGDRRYVTPETPVVLDQQGCRYTPHVLGVQVGQPVHSLKSDPRLHNAHTIPSTSNN